MYALIKRERLVDRFIYTVFLVNWFRFRTGFINEPVCKIAYMKLIFVAKNRFINRLGCPKKMVYQPKN